MQKTVQTRLNYNGSDISVILFLAYILYANINF
jgi:hypothetical protein